MYIALCAAIRTRAVLHFYYNGGMRVVEPYCHGFMAAHREVLWGYQVSGYSEPGSPPEGWRLFETAKITSLRYVGETFPTNRPGYNPRHSGIESVHCHV